MVSAQRPAGRHEIQVAGEPVQMETYYLESNSLSELVEKPDLLHTQVTQCKVKMFQFNRFLYEIVGRQWGWNDKLSWSDQQWKAYAEADGLSTWVAYSGGSPAGYFELQQHKAASVEIAYFGLVPRFIGKGLGGFLLSKAIKSAWEMGASRVWVHTCSLDHPNALRNYQARGMKIFKTESSA